LQKEELQQTFILYYAPLTA